MPTRTSITTWNGALETGTGSVELVSSKQGTFDVSFPRRIADEAGGATSPEELVGAAHSACYAMALSGVVASRGGTVDNLSVKADVTLGPDKADGGFKLTGITLTVRANLSGLSAEEFALAAEEAKKGCPLSKALAGVEITLDAALVA